jgi:hypothetical protein
MEQRIKLKYINNILQIGLVSWREAYLLYPTIIPLKIEVDKGRLVYRAKGSSKRIACKKVKAGLVKTSVWIVQQAPDWLF